MELKGIQRRLSWHNFCYNLSSMELLCTCWGKIRRILRQFQPDVVVGTGGYVSGPVLRQAAGWDSGRSPMNPMPIPA